jgi:hypothetical protein
MFITERIYSNDKGRYFLVFLNGYCDNCKDLVPLEDVVENVKSSGSVQEMEHLFDDLTKNIKTIIATLQTLHATVEVAIL